MSQRQRKQKQAALARETPRETNKNSHIQFQTVSLARGKVEINTFYFDAVRNLPGSFPNTPLELFPRGATLEARGRRKLLLLGSSQGRSGFMRSRRPMTSPCPLFCCDGPSLHSGHCALWIREFCSTCRIFFFLMVICKADTPQIPANYSDALVTWQAN